MSQITTVGIVGGGSWGSALAHAAALAGRRVMLWARDPGTVNEINRSHVNSRYLAGIPLSEGIGATTDPGELSDCDAVLLVVPVGNTEAVSAILGEILSDVCPVVLCAKGLNPRTGGVLSESIGQVMPGRPIAALSGPSFADDVARGLPTAVTIACDTESVAFDLAEALSGPTFRPYASTDLIGVQVGGALKNVLAIASGIVSGRGLGASARSALTARGFAELMRLGAHHGRKTGHIDRTVGIGRSRSHLFRATVPQFRLWRSSRKRGRTR